MLESPETARWKLIAGLVGDDCDSVLDVGCRDRQLADWLPGETGYVGVDLFPPADVIASAEEPLPFDDSSFDCVVFADVLEHLNDPHSALDEGLRVARKAVVVLLPNTYSLLHRIYYARGRPLDKYTFGPENPLDRHRWVMTFDEGRSFVHGRAEREDWEVAHEHAYACPFRRPDLRAAYGLARMLGSRNLWAWEYGARLEPAKGAPQTAAPLAATA